MPWITITEMLITDELSIKFFICIITKRKNKHILYKIYVGYDLKHFSSAEIWPLQMQSDRAKFDTYFSFLKKACICPLEHFRVNGKKTQDVDYFYYLFYFLRYCLLQSNVVFCYGYTVNIRAD